MNDETIKKFEKQKVMLDKIIDFNPHAIVIYDAEGYHARVNPQFLKLFHLKEKIGKDYCLFTDQALKDFAKEVKNGRVMRMPPSWYNPRNSGPQFEDVLIFVGSVMFPIMDENGKLENIIAVIEDYTNYAQVNMELKKKNDELEMINRSLIGREVRMADLKKENDILRNKLGEENN